MMRVVATVALVGACVGGLPKPPAPLRRANLALTISSAQLDNGLRVVIVQDPRATEIGVTMRYASGSVDEPQDQAGVAHLVEHLMFQQVLGAQSIFARLEQNATYFNAFTTYDATTYVARAAPSHLDELLAVDGVRVQFRCTTITDSAFAREREVVANEIAERDAASELRDAFHAGVYPDGHPYRRGVGGTPASVRAITRDQACAYADAHYTPGNAVLVVSGNVEIPRVEAALGKFLGKAGERTAAPPVALPAAGKRDVEVPAPIDEEQLLIAWPLPTDPLLRVRLAVVVPAVVSAIDSKIKGSVKAVRLGDTRAPMIGVRLTPGKDEAIDDLRKAAQRAIEGVPGEFRAEGYFDLGDLAFDGLQQDAIYALFSTLEGGVDRDMWLATVVLAGQDPNAALAAELTGLREMTRDDAVGLARTELAFDRATIVKLVPAQATKHGHAIEAVAAIHDRGLRLDPPEPALAHQPAKAEAPKLDGVRTRTLPNGMKVVLLPLTSVPAIDIRIVFAAGTADEPSDERGVALLASRTLAWDLRYIKDLVLFSAAGGNSHVEIDSDATAFVTQGLAMNLDVLLAGMRRWVCDGHYDGNAEASAAAMRNQAKAVDDDGALTDAWRTAIYGRGHPYVEAGLVRHAGSGLTAEEAARFRAEHYTPDNATIVIAGDFDAALADQWIDYLFTDWTGHATSRSSLHTAPQPISLAKATDTSQVHVHIALPISPDRRAANLVAAEMLADLATDVRHQLAASYDLNAGIVEERLAARFEIAGWVDAPRASEAIAFLDKRLAALRSDPDAAARAFVSARQRVLTHAASVASSAAELATRAQEDVAMARAPMFDVTTAVAALTVDDMAATLAELDLSRASIEMSGPKDDIEHAFASLKRTPQYIEVDKVDAPYLAPIERARPEFHPGDVEEALTQREPSHLEIVAAAGYASAPTIEDGDGDGAAVIAEIGARTPHAVFAAHLGFTRVTGTHDVGDLVPILKPVDALSLDVSGVVRTSVADRFWGGLVTGLHFDRASTTSHEDVSTSNWRTAFAIGLEGGVDILELGPHRLGVSAMLSTEFPDAKLVTMMLGVAYRR